MASQSLAAVRQMAKRNERMEASRKRERAKSREFKREAIGFAAAITSAGVAGYADGRLDITRFDSGAGDGVKIFGIGAMPLAAAALGVTGLAVGGEIGSGLRYSALGTLCGTIYGKGLAAGVEAAAKAAEDD